MSLLQTPPEYASGCSVNVAALTERILSQLSCRVLLSVSCEVLFNSEGSLSTVSSIRTPKTLFFTLMNCLSVKKG
jgi:hypothetical protein